MDQLGAEILKMNFLQLPIWLFFQLNFGAKIVEIKTLFLRYGNLIDDITTDRLKVGF